MIRLSEMQRIIASPLAIMIGIPLLVFGVIVTCFAARAQNKQTVERLVDQQFRDQAVAIASTAMETSTARRCHFRSAFGFNDC